MPFVAHRISIQLMLLSNIPVPPARGPGILESAAFHAYATWVHHVCLRDETLPAAGRVGFFPLAGWNENMSLSNLYVCAAFQAIVAQTRKPQN